MAKSLATVAVFAGGFSLSTIFTIPANGGVPCHENCERSRTLLSAALICFVASLFLTILVQYLLTIAPIVTKYDWDEYDFDLAMASLSISTGCLVAGFILIGVVVILINQKIAGAMIIGVTALFSMLQWEWFLKAMGELSFYLLLGLVVVCFGVPALLSTCSDIPERLNKWWTPRWSKKRQQLHRATNSGAKD